MLSLKIFVNSLFLLFLFAGVCASAQIPYAFLPYPQACFTDSNGSPLSGGFLYSDAAGSSTPLATYHLDSLGNITPNQNPIILPSTGCAEVRILPQVYKFILQDSNHVQIWAVDQVQDVGATFYGQAVLLNPVGQALQTIGSPLSVISLQLGGGTFLTTTNQSGTGSLCMTSGCAMTQSSLSLPVINGVPLALGIGAYLVLPNASTTGTTIGTLTVMNNSGQAIIATAGGSSGVLGECVSGCGINGSAVIQQSGSGNPLLCAFDGGTTAGDYIQLSTFQNGYCHDAGSSYPAIGQVVGRVLVSNASAGVYAVDLFGPENRSGIPIYNQSGVLSGPLSQVSQFSGPAGAGTTTYTFTGSAVFPHGAIACMAIDQTAANAVQVVGQSTNSVQLKGTSGDTLAGFCLGY